MNVIICKIGKFEGIIILKEMLSWFGLKVGDMLEIVEIEGVI